MLSSDPFDIDDDLFANPAALDELEASALQSTQAPPQPPPPHPPHPNPNPPRRQTQPYHHPLVRPSQTFSGRKEPAPLNTEPRAGNSGFGWEFGGKRSIDGNVERHIAAISERAAYWSHGHGNERDEEEYPVVVLGEDGRHGFGDGEEEDVVDNHARTGVGLVMPNASQQVRDVKGAQARREAIAAAGAAEAAAPVQAVRAPLSRSNSASSPTGLNRQVQAGPSNLAQQPHHLERPQFVQRSLSRSVSAGAHPVSRPPSRINPLPPISSQTSQSSQGSAARKAVFELEGERRRRETAETQLQAARDQIILEQRLREEKAREEESIHSGDDPERRLKDLQAELWRAKGEAESVRRAQRDVRGSTKDWV